MQSDHLFLVAYDLFWIKVMTINQNPTLLNVPRRLLTLYLTRSIIGLYILIYQILSVAKLQTAIVKEDSNVPNAKFIYESQVPNRKPRNNVSKYLLECFECLNIAKIHCSIPILASHKYHLLEDLFFFDKKTFVIAFFIAPSPHMWTNSPVKFG